MNIQAAEPISVAEAMKVIADYRASLGIQNNRASRNYNTMQETDLDPMDTPQPLPRKGRFINILA